MRNLYPILFAALLIAGCCGPIDDAATYSEDATPDSGSAASDQVLEDAKPYLSPIKTEDIGFRIEAANISKNCTSGDKTCQVHEVYRHVVENYNYYADPRRDEFVQSPNTTIQVGGGDCEDLTILLNTYLENIGVETYVVLTDTHAYSLACGVDTDELFYYIEESLASTYAEDFEQQDIDVEIRNGGLFFVDSKNMTFSLDPYGTYYYGGDGSLLPDNLEYVDLEYSLSSSEPLDIYIMASRDDFEAFNDGAEYLHYQSCASSGMYSTSDSCLQLDRYGGLMVYNPNQEKATIHYSVDFYFKHSLDDDLASQTVQYYEINGEECVVLDATAGRYGYPGYDGNLEGDKVAIDPVSLDYYYLS